MESRHSVENVEFSYANKASQALVTGETNSSNHGDSMTPTYGQGQLRDQNAFAEVPSSHDGVAIPQLQLDKLSDAFYLRDSARNQAFNIAGPHHDMAQSFMENGDEGSKVRAKTAEHRSRKTVQSESYLRASDPKQLNQSGYVSTKRISGPLNNSSTFAPAPTISVSNTRLEIGCNRFSSGDKLS